MLFLYSGRRLLKSPMRIGIDARMYTSSFTGIGRYVHELIRHLLKFDRTNEFVVFMNDPEYREFEPSSPRIKKVLVNAKHYSFGEQWRYWWILKREKLDLMHFTHFNAPVLYRRPSVVTVHDLTLSFFPGKKMNSAFYRTAYNFVLKSAVRNATKIIAVSQNTKQDLLDITGVASSKVEVVYNGVGEEFGPKKDADAIAELVKKYNITKPYLLYTGVWRSHKNLVNLIRAFKILREDSSLEAQLVLTGNEDPFYPEVKRTVQELGLEHDVVFTGLVPEEELPALYQGAKVYTFPSLYEGFGLTPLEAMRSGTPVVASKTACIPEICGEENVVFFDPYDPSDIANAIQKTWIDEELYRELRERGLKHSRQFSWEDAVEQTYQVYKQVLTK